MATSKILLGPIPHARYDWVSGASYGKEAIVFHKGSSYIALSDNPSTEPSFTYDPATGSYNVSAGWRLLAVGAEIVHETGDSQDKVMSQKAVTDALTASDQKLSELGYNIYLLNEGYFNKELQSLPFTDGEYISLNKSVGDVISLTPMSSSSTTYAILNCQEGDIISAKGGLVGLGSRLVGFIDSSNVLLFVTEVGLVEGTFVAPKGTAKCIVNGSIGKASAVHGTNTEIAKWKNSVEELDKLKPRLDSIVIPISGVDKYINVNVLVGKEVSLTPISQDNLRYSIYDCTEGDSFVINGIGGGGRARLWAFIDGNNNLISKASASVEAHDLILYAPANAAKIIINSTVEGVNTFKSKDNIYNYIEKRIGVNTDVYYSKDTINAFATYQSLISAYDELVTRYPYCLSKTSLGMNSLGTPIYEYKISFGSYNQEGVRGTRDEIKAKPKFLLMTGTHGYERASITSTYLFVKELVEGDKFLQKILGCVDLRVIPCLCPYGLDNNSRTNENNVNINRNFTRGWFLQGEGTNNYSGPSASSEKETQIAEAWVLANSDAKFFIDYHNSGFVNEISCVATYSNTIENCEYFKNAYLTSVASIISNLIGLRGIPSDSIFEYTSVDASGGMSHGLADELGIPSAYLETSWNVIGNGINDAASISVGADILGNMMIGFYKLFVE